MNITQYIVNCLKLKGDYNSYHNALNALKRSQFEIDFNLTDETNSDILDLINDWRINSEHTESMGGELAWFAAWALQEQNKVKDKEIAELKKKLAEKGV